MNKKYQKMRGKKPTLYSEMGLFGVMLQDVFFGDGKYQALPAPEKPPKIPCPPRAGEKGNAEKKLSQLGSFSKRKKRHECEY